MSEQVQEAFRHVHLQWFSDGEDGAESAVVDAGGEDAALDTAGSGEPEVTGGEADTLFSSGPFTWKHHDGSEWKAENRGQLVSKLKEIDERLRHGGMRHEELEPARRKLTERQKVVDDAVESYRMREENLQRAYGKYSQWDELLAKNPKLKAGMEKLIDEHKGSPGGADADLKAALEAELKPIKGTIAEWQKDREDAQRQKMRSQAFESLKQEYPDFDDKSVEQFLNDLSQTPQADAHRRVAEVAYWAMLGKQRAGEYERRQSGKPGARTSLTSTPGRPTNSPDVSSMNDNQMDDYALEIAKRVSQG